MIACGGSKKKAKGKKKGAKDGGKKEMTKGKQQVGGSFGVFLEFRKIKINSAATTAEAQTSTANSNNTSAGKATGPDANSGACDCDDDATSASVDATATPATAAGEHPSCGVPDKPATIPTAGTVHLQPIRSSRPRAARNALELDCSTTCWPGRGNLNGNDDISAGRIATLLTSRSSTALNLFKNNFPSL